MERADRPDVPGSMSSRKLACVPDHLKEKGSSIFLFKWPGIQATKSLNTRLFYIPLQGNHSQEKHSSIVITLELKRTEGVNHRNAKK